MFCFAQAQTRNRSGRHVAMGQNPNRTPSEHPNSRRASQSPLKWVLKWSGAPTPKWDPIGLDPQPCLFFDPGKGVAHRLALPIGDSCCSMELKAPQPKTVPEKRKTVVRLITTINLWALSRPAMAACGRAGLGGPMGRTPEATGDRKFESCEAEACTAESWVLCRKILP